jgi:hypothetical protein
MEDDITIIEAMHELFFRAQEMYGDAVESFWFHESEVCPCCSKSKIDMINTGKDSALMSLNSFIYRDMNVLIIYFLCSQCITKIPVSTGKKQKDLYNSIELNLKNAYHKYLESLAS